MARTLGRGEQPLLIVGLNPAWQSVLCFDRFAPGDVNRARGVRWLASGKGINCAATVRRLGGRPLVAQFVGGPTGQLLGRDLDRRGIAHLSVGVHAPTRVCTTLLSAAGPAVTELIEPAGPVTAAAWDRLWRRLAPLLGRCRAVAFCGTVPPGTPADGCARIAAATSRVPLLLDAAQSVEPLLATGIDVLKVNAAELAAMTGCADVGAGARCLLAATPTRWVAVTAGARAARLFSRHGAWRFTLPPLEGVLNPIGAGDCATGVLLRLLALPQDAPPRDKECVLTAARMVPAFQRALACASASCLELAPAAFRPAVARRLEESIRVEEEAP